MVNSMGHIVFKFTFATVFISISRGTSTVTVTSLLVTVRVMKTVTTTVLDTVKTISTNFTLCNNSYYKKKWVSLAKMSELNNNINAKIYDCILKGCKDWLSEMTISTFVARSPCPSWSTPFVTLTSRMITTHVIFTISYTVLTTVHTVQSLATFCYIENLLHFCY